MSIGSFLGGIGYGAAQGCAAGASGMILGCISTGITGAVAGGIPGVAVFLGQKYYHQFEQYIAKPQTQTILFDWLKANPPTNTGN